LAKFRKSIGLNPLLVGGRRAWSALLSRGTTPHLQAGDKGKKVLRLQLALRSAGFSKIPITGRYGAATTDVIKVVQKSRYLKRTGEVNAEFWKALQAGRIIAAPPRQEGVLHQDEIHALHGRTPTRLTVAAQGAQVVTGDTANRWLRVVCDRLL